MSSPSHRIGVFDSGVGGLTVVAQLVPALPAAKILYVADQAHVPYGGRPLDEVRRFALTIMEALVEAGCSSVVMACNISSAVALQQGAALHPGLKVAGMIEPGARAALAATGSGRIGVLATEGTVKSGAYGRALSALGPACEVREVACPDLVPLVESGELVGPAAEAALERCMAPLDQKGVDTVILGCTHYPFLLPALRAIRPGLRYVDPARALAAELTCGFHTRDGSCWANESGADDPEAGFEGPIAHLLGTTGSPALFACQAEKLVPHVAAAATFFSAHWEDDCLQLPPQWRELAPPDV